MDDEVDEGMLFLRPHCQRAKDDYSSSSLALTATSQEVVSAHLGTSKDGAATALLFGSHKATDDDISHSPSRVGLLSSQQGRENGPKPIRMHDSSVVQTEK